MGGAETVMNVKKFHAAFRYLKELITGRTEELAWGSRETARI